MREEGNQGNPGVNLGLAGSVYMLLLGIVLTGLNSPEFRPTHWWALAIFTPTVPVLLYAWRMYRADGEATIRVKAALSASMIPLLAAAVFLLGPGFADNWPMLLTVSGLGGIFGELRRGSINRRLREHVPG